MVEVHQMSHGVQNGEEERRTGRDLVELDVRVDGDVLVDRVVLHERQDVAGHGQQEQGVAERQGGGRPSCDGDPDTHNVAEVGVLRQEAVVCGMRVETACQLLCVWQVGRAEGTGYVRCISSDSDVGIRET